MVFGDNLNDLEMLEAAGIGAAVETAVPEIQACADVVVSSVEDAIREVLAGKNRIEDWVRK
jgi:hydroxymethylpyrimidine pyrophosphatase-like HAD family hydrolase